MLLTNASNFWDDTTVWDDTYCLSLNRMQSTFKAWVGSLNRNDGCGEKPTGPVTISVCTLLDLLSTGHPLLSVSFIKSIDKFT